ncbi:MAG: NAD(P)H-hydrate epimerase [Dehalococcoidia bacterium]|nr:NAD(P)H-hydrate epimerase [Dehalococcoidia bacterium]
MDTATRPRFLTATGERVPAVSTAEMREVSGIAVERTGPGLLQMMEHAGMSLALTAIEMLGDAWRDARVTVLAGARDNGAGGVCAARHLADRGVVVDVVAIRAPAQATGALGQQFLALGESPARVARWSEAFDASAADLVIDAVIGFGLDGPPRAAQMGLIRAANAARGAGVPVLALDVPSGIDADTGQAPGVAVRADATLALGLPKVGLAREHAGDLWLADLGIPPGVYARAGLVVPPLFGDSARLRLRYPEAGEG